MDPGVTLVDDPFAPPLTATFSFWGTVIGLILSRTDRKRVGAALLLLVGYGGIGVAWERTTRCDLRRLHRPPKVAMTGVVTHAPMIFLGHRILNGR